MALMDRLKHAWNAFRNRDPTIKYEYGPSYNSRPDQIRFVRGSERTIVTALYNRIAMDVAATNIRHVIIDDNKRFLREVDSGLNNCLSLEANIDQTGRNFIQDAVMSMLEEGHVALVPVDLGEEPSREGGMDILTMRTGRVLEWYPYHVKLEVFNERTQRREEVTLPKSMVSIIPNPMYAVINEPNSIMQRLIHKLRLLDIVDDKASSGKLDLIIQLPYVIKSPTRKAQAEERRKDIEKQLAEGAYGVAYTDGTEKIVQLNRPVENNLLKQIEYFTNIVYSQLGMSQELLNNTADESVLLNYFNMTIEPILSAFTDEMKRKFLTKTARTQGHTVMFFRDPFRMIPTGQLAELSDKLTRNAIITSNEVRQIIGMKPSDDPTADELRNKNLPKTKEEGFAETEFREPSDEETPVSEEQMAQSDDDVVEELLSTLEQQIDMIIAQSGGSG